MSEYPDHASVNSDITYPSQDSEYSNDPIGDSDAFYDLYNGYENPAEEEDSESITDEKDSSVINNKSEINNYPRISGQVALIYDWLVYNKNQNPDITENEKEKLVILATKIDNCLTKKLNIRELSSYEKHYYESYKMYKK